MIGKIFPPHGTDFYKPGHIRQYPKGTTRVYSNFTPRSYGHARMLPDFGGKAVWLGGQLVAQAYLIDFWTEQFFDKPLDYVLRRIKRRMDSSLGPGAVSTDQFADLHKLGYLPIHMKSLPEGSRISMKVPFWTSTNTIDEFFWLVNYLETPMSAESWGILTSATTAYEYRRNFDKFAKLTGSDPGFVEFQGHDFSLRGMKGLWDGTTSGVGHLLSFKGTDVISAIDAVEDYYTGTSFNVDELGLIGGSVPASEHSVMCMGGLDDEIQTFKRLMDIYPVGPVSIVSDTWDFWKVIDEFLPALKDYILSRNGKLVIRPDSGDPVKIILGDKEAPVGSSQYKGLQVRLWEIFGGTLTSTGHKLLDSHIGYIYGDSITLDRQNAILNGLFDLGFASQNPVLGIGSYSYQYVTRDTLGTAMKATWGVVDGVARELFKDPKTDTGLKKSAKGLLRVEKEGDEYVLYDQQTIEQEQQGELRSQFKDGKLTRYDDWATIRNRLHPVA